MSPDFDNSVRLAFKSLNDEFWKTDIAIGNDRGLLFHYTDASGLIGIFESGRLRASNASFLNDRAEGEYARRMILEEYKAISTQLKSARLYSFLGPVMDEWGKGPWNVANEQIYIACFCGDGDLLSQWRGYARQGLGFALGFDASQPIPSESGTRIRLRKVIYDEQKLRERIRGTFARTHDTVEVLCSWPGLDDEAKSLLAEQAGVILLAQLLEYTLFIKHSKWSEEQEWRFVWTYYRNDESSHLHRIGFRERHGVLVPYVSLDAVDLAITSGDVSLSASKTTSSRTPMPAGAHAVVAGMADKTAPSSPTAVSPQWRFPLRKVVIGPAHNATLTEESVRLLVHKHVLNPESIQVVHSEVPLR